MQIKLFFSPSSPYVRKCLVAAAEVGLADVIELLHGKSLKSTAYILSNPIFFSDAAIKTQLQDQMTSRLTGFTCIKKKLKN